MHFFLGALRAKILDFRNCIFLDGDVSCSSSYGVYISQLLSLVRVCSNVSDFNSGNSFLTTKFLKQG